MKKTMMLALLLLLAALCLMSCGKEEPAVQKNADPQQVELKAENLWPANDYTKGLPMPAAAVVQSMTLEEESLCVIYTADGSGKMVAGYEKALRSLGFTDPEGLSNRYMTGEVNLTDGSRVVSISREDGMMVIAVRMITENK